MAAEKSKPKKGSDAYKKYSEKGNIVERKPTCPKCGNSYFLAIHKERNTCGKCGYTEFHSK